MEWIGLLFIIWVVHSLISNRGSKKHYSIYTPKPRLNIKQIDISKVELSDEQNKLFGILDTTYKHIFVTGKAGTGKSILLQYFRQHSKKRLVVVAPTGVAALNVGGQTIHSFFKIPPTFIAKNSLRVNSRTALLLRNIDAVVIDEISMVRADLMDAMDHLLRQARSNNSSFGGVQIIMFGDLYQLPPIVSDPELHKYFSDNYGGFYFFHADVWKNTSINIYELTTIFRQSDEGFKEILNAIRTGKITEQLLTQLNQRVSVTMPTDGVVTLATTNSGVNMINEQRLNKLGGNVFEYKADITGSLDESSFPTEEILRLKRGAQVMLIKNDKEKRWVNGSIGYIDSLNQFEVKVNIDGYIYSIAKESWNKIRYYYNREKRTIEEEIISSFTQYPLRLAWAITIHKSQGQTFGSIAIDMGEGAFASGQTYVALSRCKSLDGLYLKREIFREDIIVDPPIVDFMDNAIILKKEG